jgi:GNAT superfamily N-acetyltransferase
VTLFLPDSGIRVAEPREHQWLREIEEAADGPFAEVGIGPFAIAPGDDHLGQAAVVLVCGNPPVGFVCVDVVDGLAHIWQLSVHPSAGRQGRGTALVRAVFQWAAANDYAAVTLTTFRDVPWNGPFYSGLGFVTIDELSPELRRIRDHEREIGDDAHGPRIAMRKDLSDSTSDGGR